MEKKEEYNSLRAEVLGIIDITQNYIIAMYTISIAILTLAVQQQNPWLFLLPYVVLFSFQRIISAKKDIMVRIAAYIAVFLDEDFGWEKNYKEIFEKTTVKHNATNKFSNMMNAISGRISSLQIGVVCSVGCIIMNLYGVYEIVRNSTSDTNVLDKISPMNMFSCVCALLLLAALREWCKNSLNTMQRREQYIESLTIYKNDIKMRGLNNYK